MQTVRTMIADRRGSVAAVVARRDRRRCRPSGLRLQDRPAGRHGRARRAVPIIACAIRSRSRRPNARCKSSSAPIAASSLWRNAPKLLAFAQTWKHEATGGVLIDLPAGTINEGAAAAALREIQSILAATGVPPKAMMVRSYPANARTLATIRITYPKITAQAGPCGMWPEDIGPSFNRDYFENQPHWNYGCASQRNLAAMVENPADLVQPQHETPPYTMRRTKVMEKYRDGDEHRDEISRTTMRPRSATLANDIGT